jgi:hypothetical protein
MPEIEIEDKEPLDTNAVLEVLDKEDDTQQEETEEVAEETDKEEEEESDSEESTDEIELADAEDDDKVTSDEDEEIEYVAVPSRKAIKEKFPELFKTFPGIERAIYRESRYSELFPTVKQASDAKEDLDTFNQIRNDLYSGNIENLLTTVKQNDPKAFAKIGDNIIETLGKVDQPTQLRIGTYVIKSALKAVYDRAKGSDTESAKQYALAAQYMSEAIFGTTEITGPDNKATKVEENPKERELAEKERQFNQQRLESAVSDVTGKTKGIIKRTIEKYIDPRESMNSYVRGKAIEDALESLDDEISKDTRFRHHLSQLWMASAKDNYSERSTAKIREAIINRAKNTLGGHIKKARAVALKGLGAKPTLKKKSTDDDQPETRRTAAPARQNNSSSSNRSGGKPTVVGGVADVMEFLNRNNR